MITSDFAIESPSALILARAGRSLMLCIQQCHGQPSAMGSGFLQQRYLVVGLGARLLFPLPKRNLRSGTDIAS